MPISKKKSKLSLDSLKQKYENKKKADTKPLELEQLKNRKLISQLNDIISSDRNKIHELEKNNEQHQKMKEDKKIIIENLEQKTQEKEISNDLIKRLGNTIKTLEQTIIQLNQEVSSKCNKKEKLNIELKEIKTKYLNQRKIVQERIEKINKIKLLRNLKDDFKSKLETKDKKIQELELNLSNQKFYKNKTHNQELKNKPYKNISFKDKTAEDAATKSNNLKKLSEKIQNHENLKDDLNSKFKPEIIKKKIQVLNERCNSLKKDNTSEVISIGSKRSITNQSNSLQDNEQSFKKFRRNSDLSRDIELNSNAVSGSLILNKVEESTSGSIKNIIGSILNIFRK